MDGARVAGFVVLGLCLVTAGFLGAPVDLLVLIGAAPLASLFLPRGVGAAALSNLAQRLYDREAWERGWDAKYLPAGEHPGLLRRRRRRAPDQEPPPDLFPEDLRESKAWLRTLASIRRLPERQHGVPRSRRRPPQP